MPQPAHYNRIKIKQTSHPLSRMTRALWLLAAPGAVVGGVASWSTKPSTDFSVVISTRRHTHDMREGIQLAFVYSYHQVSASACLFIPAVLFTTSCHLCGCLTFPHNLVVELGLQSWTSFLLIAFGSWEQQIDKIAAHYVIIIEILVGRFFIAYVPCVLVKP